MSNGQYFWYFVGLALSSPMNVLGSLLIIMLAVVLARAQASKTSKIDFSYLLVDSTVGNVTLAKFAGFGAFLASTWVFIDLAVVGHFDTTYAIAYVAGWGGFKVATDYALRDGGAHRDG